VSGRRYVWDGRFRLVGGSPDASPTFDFDVRDVGVTVRYGVLER
jgi:hypothetical protein